MTKFKSMLACVVAGALLLAGQALAQPAGQLGPGQVWGNPTLQRAPAQPTTLLAVGGRKALTADTTFNVATTGVDSNNCTVSAPCRNMQRAYDNLANFYDLQGFTATIKLADGTYTAGLITSKCVLGQNGPGGVQILGSATPANVLISVTSNDAFGLGETSFGAGLQGCTQVTIGGMKLVTTTAGNAINVSGGGVAITIGTPGFPIEFGASAQNHVVGGHAAWAIAGTNNIISGNALVSHIAGLSGSQVALHNTCEVINGALTMQYYVLGDSGSQIFLEGMAWNSGACAAGSGSITTSVARYLVQNFSTIYTLSASASYLPGSATGVVQSKGNYVTNLPSQWAISTDISGLGTGVATALGTNVGSAGAPVIFNGPLGTPSGGVGTNLSALNGSLISLGTVANARLAAVNLAAGNVNGGVVNTLPNVIFQSSVLSPASTTSTTGVMMGMGASCSVTPAYSGRIKVEWSGAFYNSVLSNQTTAQLRYGTGGAPANGAAATGTAGSQVQANAALANGSIPFTLPFAVSLSVGTTYWFDIALIVSGGTGGLQSVSCNITEN